MPSIYNAPYLDLSEHALLDHTGVPGVGAGGGGGGTTTRAVGATSSSSFTFPTETGLAVAVGAGGAVLYFPMNVDDLLTAHVLAIGSDGVLLTVSVLIWKVADASGVPVFIPEQYAATFTAGGGGLSIPDSTFTAVDLVESNPVVGYSIEARPFSGELAIKVDDAGVYAVVLSSTWDS